MILIKKRNLYYELCMSVLALLAVSLAVLDIIKGLNPWQAFCDNLILIIFVLDYFIRFFLADNKRSFFRENILDFIAIIPFSSAFKVFRVFKFFKLMRLTKVMRLTKLLRLFSYLLRAGHKFRRFFNTNGFKYVVFITVSVIITGGIAIHFAENLSFPDGIWWAFVTATTVGYGDISPHTLAGRIIAIFLMLTGIGMVGSLTSTITSFFMNHTSETANHSANADSFESRTLTAVIRDISDIKKLSDQDIDQICQVLKTLNKS